MSLIVQKYGGTSVSTTEKIKLIASHIAETVNQDNKLLVVV
ncbi:MAG: aspartate kinase, partial [Zetaproteobacteria bacterium]|nr:aspartate kinase [Pseudobdellovibrionaceae bacterium]